MAWNIDLYYQRLVSIFGDIRIVRDRQIRVRNPVPRDPQGSPRRHGLLRRRQHPRLPEHPGELQSLLHRGLQVPRRHPAGGRVGQQRPRRPRDVHPRNRGGVQQRSRECPQTARPRRQVPRGGLAGESRELYKRLMTGHIKGMSKGDTK